MVWFSGLRFAAAFAWVGMAAPATAVVPEGAFGWMAELAGHCWTATYPDGTRDTQCYNLQYDRYLRGTIEIVPPQNAGARPPYRGDSVFFWRPASRELAFHFWSNAGNDGVSLGRVEGDQLVFPTLARDGGEPRSRMIWSRIGPDRFRVVQQRRIGEAWLEGLSLVYSRSGPARTPAAE